MLMPIPESGRVAVPDALAGDLLAAAERLPVYDNKDFYSTDLQLHVRDHIRETCPDGFQWLVAQISERLAQWPYCVLVAGLRFDEGNRLFVGLNSAFGELVARPYEKPRAQLVHYIQPATDIPSVRGGRESERLHTDTADWETPVQLISMMCVRADPDGGGHSRILDVDSVRDEVRGKLGDEALKRLETEPVPWQLAPYCGGGLRWRPVLSESSICWRRYTINLALDSGGANLSEKMLKLLDSFEEVVSSTPQTVDFLMREGELLFSDNWRTIHARTPIANPNTSERLMIRSWIRVC
jgi:alpha-ketoglutarate-dependent taurine dioxygenase